MMETKSIHSPNLDARQKLDFLDTSYEPDNLKNVDSEQEYCKSKDMIQNQDQGRCPNFKITTN